MGSDWKTLPLESIVTLQRGHDLPTPKRIKGNIPIMGSFGITGWHNEFKSKGPGVTIGRSGGSMGVVNFIDTDYWPLNTALYVKNFMGNDPLFIYLFLSQINFLTYNSGSAQPSLNRNLIYGIELNLPPLHEQKAIAHILGSLDDKIELNRQMNQTLEQMAQALFKSWFVNFDPVIDNALAVGNKIPDALKAKTEQRLTVIASGTRQSLPEQIQKLFPNEFEFSEELDKWIPKGWRVDSASNIYNISIGKTPPRKESEWFTENDSDVKWASIRDMGDSGFMILETNEFLTNEAINTFNIKIVPKGTVLLSFKLTLGRVCIATENMCSNEAIAHFRINGATPSSLWTLLYLKQYDYDILGSTSSIATAINSKIVKSMPFLIPKMDIITAFDKYSNIILGKIELNERSIQSLTKLRDTLLPKLISGEVRVPEIEKFENK